MSLCYLYSFLRSTCKGKVQNETPLQIYKARIGFTTSKPQRITLILAVSLNGYPMHIILQYKLFSFTVVVETHFTADTKQG